MPPCEACAIGKARQKNLGSGGKPLTAISELWHIDGTSIRKTTSSKGPFPKNNKAVMMIEARRGTGWVAWYDTKNTFHNPFLSKMNLFQAQQKHLFARIRCDDVGKNKTFIKKANDENSKFTIQPEYTPYAMPQQNTAVKMPTQVIVK